MGKVNPAIKKLKEQIEYLDRQLVNERDRRITAEAKLEQYESHGEKMRVVDNTGLKALRDEVGYLRELVSNITLDQYKITAIADAKVKLMQAVPDYQI